VWTASQLGASRSDMRLYVVSLGVCMQRDAELRQNGQLIKLDSPEQLDSEQSGQLGNKWTTQNKRTARKNGQLGKLDSPDKLDSSKQMDSGKLDNAQTPSNLSRHRSIFSPTPSHLFSAPFIFVLHSFGSLQRQIQFPVQFTIQFMVQFSFPKILATQFFLD
jgi:hypothetical protein